LDRPQERDAVIGHVDVEVGPRDSEDEVVLGPQEFDSEPIPEKGVVDQFAPPRHLTPSKVVEF